jgi:hypothetical protein
VVGQLGFDLGADLRAEMWGMRAMIERTTLTSAAPIACSATAAAVAGSFGSTGAPLSPRLGSTSVAAAIRARASPCGTRATARTRSAVVRYPKPPAISRESISATTDSICAQVECNRVSNAPRSATNAASLDCQAVAVDMPQFYNEALTNPAAMFGAQTQEPRKIIRGQRTP